MLSADFGHLDRDTRMIDKSAAQWIHIDVMDGVFVPNISFGFPVLKFIRQATTKPLDVHLMIVEPERYVKRFAEAGSDIVTFHYEATNAAHRCIDEIHAAGARAGISIKPATSVEVLRDLLPSLDLVLVMSVEPGFGGQKFMDGALGKIAQLRRTIDEAGLSTLIEVDGGISAHNARLLFDTGADVLVAGNAVFGADDPKAEIERMLDVLNGGVAHGVPYATPHFTTPNRHFSRCRRVSASSRPRKRCSISSARNHSAPYPKLNS